MSNDYYVLRGKVYHSLKSCGECKDVNDFVNTKIHSAAINLLFKRFEYCAIRHAYDAYINDNDIKSYNYEPDAYGDDWIKLEKSNFYAIVEWINKARQHYKDLKGKELYNNASDNSFGMKNTDRNVSNGIGERNSSPFKVPAVEDLENASAESVTKTPDVYYDYISHAEKIEENKEADPDFNHGNSINESVGAHFAGNQFNDDRFKYGRVLNESEKIISDAKAKADEILKDAENKAHEISLNITKSSAEASSLNIRIETLKEELKRLQATKDEIDNKEKQVSEIYREASEHYKKTLERAEAEKQRIICEAIESQERARLKLLDEIRSSGTREEVDLLIESRNKTVESMNSSVKDLSHDVINKIREAIFEIQSIQGNVHEEINKWQKSLYKNDYDGVAFSYKTLSKIIETFEKYYLDYFSNGKTVDCEEFAHKLSGHLNSLKTFQQNYEKNLGRAGIRVVYPYGEGFNSMEHYPANIDRDIEDEDEYTGHRIIEVIEPGIIKDLGTSNIVISKALVNIEK